MKKIFKTRKVSLFLLVIVGFYLRSRCPPGAKEPQSRSRSMPVRALTCERACSGNEIERTLVLSGHVIRARLPYEVGVGRLITFVSKCFKIVTVLFH